VNLTGSNSISLTQSILNTRTANSNGNAGPITVIAPTVALENNFITTEVQGPLTKTANGGSVVLGGPQTNNVSMISSSIFTDSVETEGNGGSVTITGQTVTIGGDGFGSPTITTSTHHDPFTGPFPTSGNAGDIQIIGTNVTFTNAAWLGSVADTPATSSRGGNISVNGAQSILVDSGTVFTTTTISEGNAGNIQLTSPHVTVTGGSQIGSTTEGGGGSSGTITVNSTENIAIDSGSLITTVAGPDSRGSAGQIFLNTPHLTIIGGSTVANQNLGTGAGGTVTVQGVNGAAQSVLISDASIIFTNTDIGTGTGSSIFVDAHSFTLQNGSSMFAGTNAAGNGGNILVKADSASITGGSQISSSSVIGDSGTIPTGNAGSVTIEGTASPAQSVLIDGFGSGIFTETAAEGAGGSIILNANSLTLQNGGTLSALTSGTASTATGGIVTVDANQVQLNSGALITASTTGAGDGGSVNINVSGTFSSNAGTVSSTATQAAGGDINISAGQSVTLDNGSLITASSNGEGNAGNILINAGQQYRSINSSVTTQAEEASGGNITVLATGLVHLTNSELNASVEGSSTTVGGNILIDPLYVILENTQIVAQATQGQGGNINIFYTGAFLADPSSVIDASSQFGQSGTVTIQSPISPASGKINPLGQKPLITAALVNQRCAALAGGSISSFTVAGRDSLPSEPGGWLASPLALAAPSVGAGLEARGEGEDGSSLLSLRQLGPTGFLTQVFAVESSGCQS
jgi:large exoprotein involved in heme utilization and adhesion